MPADCEPKYFRAGGKLVSKRRFDEIVSLYFDGRADKAEIELLAEILECDESAARLFAKTLCMQRALCRAFGKPLPKLEALPKAGLKRQKPALRHARARLISKRAAVEWSLVVAFMLLSAAFFRISNSVMANIDVADGVCGFSDALDGGGSCELFLSERFLPLSGSESSGCALFSYRARGGE